MKLYSYVMVSDTGFAPNPNDDFCTLACCKPKIRRVVSLGDWVIGTGSKGNVGNHKLIYAMKITEKKDFDSYYNDVRFKNRIDNIYFKYKGEWFQKPNQHHHEQDISHDLSGECVLISNYFYYFGKKAIEIPEQFREVIKKGPGHKSNFSEDLITDFLVWLKEKYNPGKIGNPYESHDELDAKK